MEKDLLTEIAVFSKGWRSGDGKHDDHIGLLFAALADREVTATYIWYWIQCEMEKDSLDYNAALRDLIFLFSLIPAPQMSQFVVSVTDNEMNYDYFISLLTHETGFSVKAGIKDFGTMGIISSEYVQLTWMHEALPRYFKSMPNMSPGLAQILVNSFISSLLTNLDLCLDNLKPPSSTAKA